MNLNVDHRESRQVDCDITLSVRARRFRWGELVDPRATGSFMG